MVVFELLLRFTYYVTFRQESPIIDCVQFFKDLHHYWQDRYRREVLQCPLFLKTGVTHFFFHDDGTLPKLNERLKI